MPSYAPNIVLVNVTGVGDLTSQLIHFSKVIGAKPSEFTVLLINKRPKDVVLADYQGKAATISIDGVVKLTGNVMRVEKQFTQQNVLLTVQDYRWKMNATYVGASLLDALDGNGVPSTFNGLPYYGADVVFNLNGMPNKSKTALEFVPPGYEHSIAYADFWTYGQALEWLWSNCVTDVALPSNGGLSPKDWTFGGTNKKMEESAMFGKPVAEAIDEIVGRTRCQWYLGATNTPVFFSIDNPVATFVLNVGNPDAPVTPTDHTPIELDVEVSTDDTIGQLDIVGGKQQREVTLGTSYSGSIYNGTQVQTATDWEQVPWFGIETSGGWNVPGLTWVGSPYDLKWTNYSVERYLHVYTAALMTGETFQEYTYRYNLKSDIYEAHKIGKNLPIPTPTVNFQPYKMLSQTLLARDKNGAFVNPDDPLAYEGISPLELLKTQYPDGANLDLDRGYLTARGGAPWLIQSSFIIQPPWYSVSNPTKLTIVFECAGRAYVSSTNAVAGLPTQIRRCVVRDEFIHKTCEATDFIMPVVVDIDALANWTVIEGVAVPAGWIRNYSLSGNIYTSGPIRQQDFTISRPAGIVVDGIGKLNEIKSVVSPYVGLPMVNGSGALPTWVDLELGTRLTGAASQFGTTDLEVVTAIAFTDENQRLEFGFSNRMGIDIANLSSQFVNRFAYIRPL